MPDAAKPRRSPADDGLLIVGLVGRAGSGKSSVARVLAAAGARVLDADRMGHAITDHDPEVRDALLADYGPAVFLDDGTLNRRLVAARVFADSAALAALNRLVHPRILATLRAQLVAFAAEGFHGTVLVDAALMLDWGFERDCDAVLAVIAPETEQVARLVAARGWTADEARRRLGAQRPDAAFAAAADAVIDNRGSEAELESAALAALARITAGRARSLR